MSALPSERPPTLLDVARAAGVSKATVSKVASGNGVVAEFTRHRIERAAVDIGYRWRRTQPHLTARGPARLLRPQRETALARRSELQIEGLREVDARAAAMIFSMSKDDHRQYVLEGAISLSGCEVADEDHDPTPVPTGCPGCWRRDVARAGMQGVCLTCPDPPSRQEVRAAIGTVRGPLSPLERKVAQRAAAGYSYREIADQLGITPRTACSYRGRACAKLGVDQDELAGALAALDG